MSHREIFWDGGSPWCSSRTLIRVHDLRLHVKGFSDMDDRSSSVNQCVENRSQAEPKLYVVLYTFEVLPSESFVLFTVLSFQELVFIFNYPLLFNQRLI